MEKQGLLTNCRVAIIDPSSKKENDKTFFFWAHKEDNILLENQDLNRNHWTHIQNNNNKNAHKSPTILSH